MCLCCHCLSYFNPFGGQMLYFGATGSLLADCSWFREGYVKTPIGFTMPQPRVHMSANIITTGCDQIDVRNGGFLCRLQQPRRVMFLQHVDWQGDQYLYYTGGRFGARLINSIPLFRSKTVVDRLAKWLRDVDCVPTADEVPKTVARPTEWYRDLGSAEDEHDSRRPDCYKNYALSSFGVDKASDSMITFEADFIDIFKATTGAGRHTGYNNRHWAPIGWFWARGGGRALVMGAKQMPFARTAVMMLRMPTETSKISERELHFQIDKEGKEFHLLDITAACPLDDKRALIACLRENDTALLRLLPERGFMSPRCSGVIVVCRNRGKTQKGPRAPGVRSEAHEGARPPRSSGSCF